MPAQLKFYGGDFGQYDIDAGGSGIGFYGNSFGDSVAVDAYQDSTFVTNANGNSQGASLHNWKWVHARSGEFGGNDTVYAISGVPNSYATCKIRFTNDTTVKCQNVKMRIYDRSDITRAQSGVTVQLAELCRPNQLFGDSFTTAGPWGSGSTQWTTCNPVGSSTVYTFINQSPGPSGINGRNPNGSGTVHEWFMLMSASPTSISSKYFAAWVQLEYL